MPTIETQISASIGKAIQFWRKIEGLTQKDLAERLNVMRSYIAKVERAHVGISHGRIKEFAEVLGISPYTILNGMPGDKEIKALLNIYSDIPFKLTKEEMEIIFRQEVVGGVDPEKFFRHIVDVSRGGGI